MVLLILCQLSSYVSGLLVINEDKYVDKHISVHYACIPAFTTKTMIWLIYKNMFNILCFLVLQVCNFEGHAMKPLRINITKDLMYIQTGSN